MHEVAKHQIQNNDNSGEKQKLVGLRVSIPEDLGSKQ